MDTHIRATLQQHLHDLDGAVCTAMHERCSATKKKGDMVRYAGEESVLERTTHWCWRFCALTLAEEFISAMAVCFCGKQRK